MGGFLGRKMKIKFVKLQKDKLADLSIGLGHIFFGTTVLPYFLPVVDRPFITVLIWGLELRLVYGYSQFG